MGTQRDRLAITTAYVDLNADDIAKQPLHGAVFTVAAPRGRGLPESRYGLAY
jgi:L-arabinonolactonase